MTSEEIVAYYKQLLIVQYAAKPKMAAAVSAFVAELVSDSISQTVRDGFALGTAVGVQLDVMGTYRGIVREIYGLDVTKDYFQLVPTTAPDYSIYHGFALTSQAPAIDWYFIRPKDISATQYVLNDGEFEKVIRYIAAVHRSFYSLEEIDDILYEFFGTNLTVTDNEDMTITYTHQLSDPELLFKFAQSIDALPRPAGVGINIVEV